VPQVWEGEKRKAGKGTEGKETKQSATSRGSCLFFVDVCTKRKEGKPLKEKKLNMPPKSCQG